MRVTAERKPLRAAKRVVVKVGTNVVTRAGGEIAIGTIHAIIEQTVALVREGRQVILVTSGAIGLGMNRLGFEARPAFLAQRQACAAVGQGQLMALYDQGFGRLGVATAQVLLTEDDFANRVRYLNLRNAVQELLRLGVVPIVNENDTVSTAEIEGTAGGERAVPFGDNDMLSALLMSKMDAEVLVILSDVEGLYDRAPGEGRRAKRIPIVAAFGPEIEALARGGAGRGRGGIRTKLEAARVATRCGGHAVIAHGQRPNVLQDIFSGRNVGTVFLPRAKLSGRKRWIAFATAPAGSVSVNDGARAALVERNASLLWAGIEKIGGHFERGDVISIRDSAGREFARGIANCSSALARKLAGKHSTELAEVTDGVRDDVLVARDNIAITRT
ncbi:MAG: glutamate 5-kinase [Planctomycetes bacterium]|nr:glutamate 5-kinase [Planctomycetota bacterium]